MTPDPQAIPMNDIPTDWFELSDVSYNTHLHAPIRPGRKKYQSYLVKSYLLREILLARIWNPIFVQKVPGSIKNRAEITGILVPDSG